jgi:hypothetical protein
VCVLCSPIKTITHWHLICSRRAQQYTHENPVKALSDEHNDHDGVEPRTSTTTTTALSHGDSDYRIRGGVTGGPGGLPASRSGSRGRSPVGQSGHCPHVGARADRGDAGRRG